MDQLVRLDPPLLAAIVAVEVILIWVGTRSVTSSILSGVPWAPLAYPFVAPGTVLHELAHAVVARILGVRVKRIVLFRPKWDGFVVELGQVVTATTTPVRQALISLAPLILIPPLLLVVAVIAINLPANLSGIELALLALSALASLGAFPSSRDRVGIRGAAPLVGVVAIVGFAAFLIGGPERLGDGLAAIVLLLAVPAGTFGILAVGLLALAVVEAAVFSDDDEEEPRAVPVFITRSAPRRPNWPAAPRPNWRGRRRR